MVPIGKTLFVDAEVFITSRRAERNMRAEHKSLWNSMATVHTQRRLRTVLCLLVILFAWQAKVAPYRFSSRVKVSPSQTPRIWLAGQKIDVTSMDSGLQAPTLAAVGAKVLPDPRRRDYHYRLVLPPFVTLAQHHLPWFFRPPPAEV